MTDLVDDLDLASIKDSATPKKSCYKVWGVGIRNVVTVNLNMLGWNRLAKS